MPGGELLFDPLPPEEAIRYFESKGQRVSWNWHQLWREQHLFNFTVAHCAQLDLLKDIQAAVGKALKEGQTQREFNDGLIPQLQKAGWWGTKKEVPPDAQDGREEEYEAGSYSRLRTILNTNLNVAYAAGQYRQDMDNMDSAPFWMYDAVNDGRARASHAALDGKIFRADDPVWDVIYPPNDWGCRCKVIPLSANQVASMGKSVLTGTASGKGGQDVLKEEYVNVAKPEWSYNPGKKPDEVLAVLWEKVGALENKRQAGQILSGVANRIVEPYRGWIDEIVSRGASRGESRIVGFMGDKERDWMIERGQKVVNGVLRVTDRLVVGPKGRRHKDENYNACTPEELKQIPFLLLQRKTILRDTVTDRLLYVLPSSDSRKIQIVIELAYWDNKAKVEEESMRSLFKIDTNALEDQRRYERIEWNLD